MITDTVDKSTWSTYETSDPPKIRRECTNGHLSLLRADLAFFFFFNAEFQMKRTNASGSQQSTTKHKSVPMALACWKENHLCKSKSDKLLWNHCFSCCTVIQLDKKGKISTVEVFALGLDTGDNAKFNSRSRTNRNCELFHHINENSFKRWSVMFFEKDNSHKLCDSNIHVSTPALHHLRIYVSFQFSADCSWMTNDKRACVHFSFSQVLLMRTLLH